MISRKRSVGIRHRAGTVLFCVLACLVVIMTLIATSIQIALRTRQECKNQVHVAQAELCCLAACHRAQNKWKVDPSYVGETWVTNLDTNESRTILQSEILVKEVVAENKPSTMHIEVHVELSNPDWSVSTIRRSHQYTLPNSFQTTGETP